MATTGPNIANGGVGAIGLPAIGFVTFRSDNGLYSMTCLLGDGSAKTTGGYGGWQIKPRARRRGFTQWDGNDPYQIDIPIMIDHFNEPDGGVRGERDILQLERMAGWRSSTREPPLIQFNAGGAIQHDATDNPKDDWVITNIEWGDCEKTTFGNRSRQAAVVTVMQFVEDDAISNQSAAQRQKGRKNRKKGKSKRGAPNKRYTVKRGDTLPKIAARQLGSSKRWHEIARLNGLRDPNKLKVGQVLRLP